MIEKKNNITRALFRQFLFIIIAGTTFPPFKEHATAESRVLKGKDRDRAALSSYRFYTTKPSRLSGSKNCIRHVNYEQRSRGKHATGAGLPVY